MVGGSPVSAHIAEANEAVEVFGNPSVALEDVFTSIRTLQEEAMETKKAGREQRTGGSECALLCDYCGSILCRKEDIISEKAAVWGDQVYTYDLEIFEGEETPVYSATNPSANRFDVVRVKPDVVGMSLISCTPAYFPDHSWFPPYEWSMASCAGCGKHMGWGFALRNASEASPSPPANNREGSTKKKQNVTSSSSPPPVAAAGGEEEGSPSGSDGDYETCSTNGDEEEDGYASSSPDASPGDTLNMDPLSFIGLIVTHTKCEEKLTSSFVTTNLETAPARLEANLEYHRGRKAVVNRFRHHEARLRATGQYLTIMSLLNLLDSFSFTTRPAMQQLCIAVEDLLHTPAASTTSLTAEVDEEDGNNADDNDNS